MLSLRSKSERRRNFIGNELDECKDLSGLYYLLPCQKGYLVNWDIQRKLWDYVFGNDVLGIRTQDYHLVLTEPIFNFPSIQDTLNEIFFEEYKFKSLLRAPAPSFSSVNHSQAHPDSLCCLVVDSGYSFTHVVPYYRSKFIPDAVLRLDVGGKLLTNYLKEIVSYRQLHVLDETYVINQVKEDMCYVTQDFYGDMAVCKKRGSANTILREYVLPDFTTRRRGFTCEAATKAGHQSSDEQCLRLANERFSVPEILFHPSDVGIDQMGIAECIVQSISKTPPEMHPHLYSNIVLTGGSTCFPGFYKRVLSEVRKLAPDVFDVQVYSDGVNSAWYGGRLATNPHKRPKHFVAVSLAEYKEHGHSICHRQFTDLQTWTP